MKCRIDITGQKIWQDAANLYGTRPENVEIVLFRDGVEYKTAVLDAESDGKYRFPCLLVQKDNENKYVYTVDEREVPNGYTKTIDGYNVVNTLNNVTISGVKTWSDYNNAAGVRPQQITLRLFQNGREIDSLLLDNYDDTVTTVNYTFGERPFLDDNKLPYMYHVDEDGPFPNYAKIITGYNILNIYTFFTFSFTKTNARTAETLKDASFELLQNGVVKASAVSDDKGLVTFRIEAGSYQLQERRSPVGFLDDISVYQVDVSTDGAITVDGVPAASFEVTNQPTPYSLRSARANS